MSKFTVAGVSTLNGVTKVRYANDITRVKNLQKGGHTNIDLIELGRAMEKNEIAAYLQSIKFDNGNKAVADAIAREVTKREPKAAKAPATAVKTKSGVKVTPKTTAKAPKAKAKAAAPVEAEPAPL